VKRKLKSEKGMTLIEIMIVMAILAGIASALVGVVKNSFIKSKIKTARLIISETSKALELYYTDCGFYPTADDGLDALLNASDACSDWGPEPYIKKLPKDPWGSELVYDSDGSTFTLVSLGGNRKEGGKGADADISSED